MVATNVVEKKDNVLNAEEEVTLIVVIGIVESDIVNFKEVDSTANQKFSKYEHYIGPFLPFVAFLRVRRTGFSAMVFVDVIDVKEVVVESENTIQVSRSFKMIIFCRIKLCFQS